MFKLLDGNNRIRLDETGLVQRQGRGLDEWIDITPYINGNGYPTTTIDGKQYMIHRLVASMFIPNPEPLSDTIVHHKDEDITNYSADNLKWTNTSDHIGIHLLESQRKLNTPESKTTQVMLGVRSDLKQRLSDYKGTMTYSECINYLLDVVEIMEKR